MLFDPDRKTRLDTDTLVPTGDREKARRWCRSIAASEQERGEVIAFRGVIQNKSKKSHRCVFEREIQED